ncbi:MAG TPA: murein L,D-transpeptidase catalytic domain family protein [Thermoanaerobaculia bacterium]|nr:murein L,D-transpeptidase catalytic domain family protein [Thermoanaerobaculia bacterium]
MAAVLLTVFALSPGFYVPETSTADAAVIRATPVPLSVKAASVPAVQAPATALFAQRVPGLSPEVLRMALDRVACARSAGVSGRDDLLTVIDYTLPSTEPRLWVLDLEKGKVLYHELVAHGKGSGENYATRFSNQPNSLQTSLGLFRTSGTYDGGNGYSLKLQGLDAGVNDLAEPRYIVMHGAPYVSEAMIRSQGRLGRSWGCPAVSQHMARPVIDTIKGGSFVFSYSGKDKSWLKTASAQQTCGGSGNGPVSASLATR